MRYRRFGRTGWQVSEIGYGMWGMGGWTGSDDEESLRALDRAVALGCNFFDTAWVYGAGKSETAARPGAARAPGRAGCTSPPRSRRRTCKWPAQGRVPGRRHLSRRPHPRVHREEPREPRRATHRPAAVPRLERRLGRRRRLAARGRRSEAREADPRVRHQRQPLGADQRAARARHRARSTASRWSTTSSTRRRRTSCFPYCQRARHRRHRARAVRRRQPDRHADAATRRGRRATGGTSTSRREQPRGDARARRPPARRWCPRGWTCPSWRCGSSSSTRRSARPSRHAPAAHVERNLAASDGERLPPRLREALEAHRWDACRTPTP